VSVNIIARVPGASVRPGVWRVAGESFLWRGASFAHVLCAGQTARQPTFCWSLIQAPLPSNRAGTSRCIRDGKCWTWLVIDGLPRNRRERPRDWRKFRRTLAMRWCWQTGAMGTYFSSRPNAKGCNVTATWRHTRRAFFANPLYTQIILPCIPGEPVNISRNSR